MNTSTVWTGQLSTTVGVSDSFHLEESKGSILRVARPLEAVKIPVNTGNQPLEKIGGP